MKTIKLSQVSKINYLPLDMVNEVRTGAFNTTAWTTSVYNELIAPGVLQPGFIYTLKVQLDKSGTDNVIASYEIPITVTALASTQPPDFTPVSITSYQGATTAFKIRLKKGASVTFGIEATLSDSGLIGGDFKYILIPKI